MEEGILEAAHGQTVWHVLARAVRQSSSLNLRSGEMQSFMKTSRSGMVFQSEHQWARPSQFNLSDLRHQISQDMAIQIGSEAALAEPNGGLQIRDLVTQGPVSDPI